MLEVRRGDTEVRDVQNVADIPVDPEGALERRNHWEKTSHSLLVGVILHVLYAEADKTLCGVANFLSDRNDRSRRRCRPSCRRGTSAIAGGNFHARRGRLCAEHRPF
jgi:Type IV secretory system Conjugative DNA transfer